MSQLSRKFEKPFLISLLVGAFAIFIFVDLPPYINGLKATSWPHTKGAIDSLDQQFYTLGRDPAWTPKVQYHYTVNGVDYTSERISFQPPIGIPGYESGEYSEKYKVENEVKVFYDPQNPKQAYLENNPSLTVGIAHLVAYLIFVFIMYLSVYPKIDEGNQSPPEISSAPKIEPEPQTL